MKNILLVLIIVLAVILRFNMIGSVPALNADEAALGYNAYSLLQTGRDEHGNSWPIHFQSFNDYKPGLYVYLVMPFIAVLGMTEFAVRLPGVLLGVGTIIVLYFLIKELFPKVRFLPEMSALFLAISPWHIHFSRGAWEVNVATFFIVSGMLTLLIALRKKSILVYLTSIILFAASLYTYHAARLVVPLIVLTVFITYKKEVFGNLKKFLPITLIGLLLLIPLALDLAKPTGLSRAAGVGLFADSGPYWRVNQQRGEHNNLTGPLAKILHNKPVNYSLAFLQNYSEHFWGEFLFVSGDEIQRNKVPEMGQLYLTQIVFLLIGFFAIAKNFSTSWRIIIAWLAIAPIAAALTFQSPHALRAHNMVIPLTAISAYGLVIILEWVKETFKRKQSLLPCLYILLIIAMVWDFTRYLHQYYAHMEKTYDYSSQHGVKELSSYINEHSEEYSKIVVTTAYDQPYILILFYSKYPPQDFQNQHTLTSRDEFGFSTVSEFGKFVFQPINLVEVKQQYPNSLIIGTDKEIPIQESIVKEMYFPSGRTVFRVVKN